MVLDGEIGVESIGSRTEGTSLKRREAKTTKETMVPSSSMLKQWKRDRINGKQPIRKIVVMLVHLLIFSYQLSRFHVYRLVPRLDLCTRFTLLLYTLFLYLVYA